MVEILNNKVECSDVSTAIVRSKLYGILKSLNPIHL